MQEITAAEGTPTADAGSETTESTENKGTPLNLPDRLAAARPDALALSVDTLPPFPQVRTPEPPRPKTRLKLPIWLVAGGMFLIGLLLGVAVMRHRNHTEQIVIAVNNDSITRDDLFNHLQDAAGLQTVHAMVQNLLQLQFAQKEGLAPTQAQVDAEFAKMNSRPNFAQALKGSGVLEGDFRENLRVQLAETNVITQGVTATDADARAYYQAQSNPSNVKAQFYRPAQISLRAIATKTEPQARQALTELASQTPFELVATTYSYDDSAKNGGLLAPLAFGRSPLHRTPALEQSVFAMKIGDQIGPVQFLGKWWIFRYQDKAAAVTVPYAQVQDQCLTGAKLIKGMAQNGKRITQEFNDFQRSSNLQAFWPQYQKAIATH